MSYALDDFERVLVLGGGNAADRMAAALETRLGDRIDGGIVVTDDPASLDVVESVTGSHPTPDRAALEGTDRLLALAEDTDEDDLLLGAVTGGGGALLPGPAGDVTLEDLQALTESPVRSGATIDESNGILSSTDTVQAVNDVSIDVAENDAVALVGESGCGKTTLGKAAIGLQRPTDGSVSYRGQDIWDAKDGRGTVDIPYEEIRRSLQIIPGSGEFAESASNHHRQPHGPAQALATRPGHPGPSSADLRYARRGGYDAAGGGLRGAISPPAEREKNSASP